MFLGARVLFNWLVTHKNRLILLAACFLVLVYLKTKKSCSYKSRLFTKHRHLRPHQIRLASSIGLERETFNLKVAGSSPALGFYFFISFLELAFLLWTPSWTVIVVALFGDKISKQKQSFILLFINMIFFLQLTWR